jgi:hypothetical protein
MLILSEGRELPAPPVFFGIIAFATLSLLLYLAMRIDKDH